MSMNQIGGKHFSAIAASFNPPLKFAPFGRWDRAKARGPLALR
jgi:hypothetical protein